MLSSLCRRRGISVITQTAQRCLSTEAVQAQEPQKPSPQPKKPRPESYAHYRHIYPEFLPDPDPTMRNKLREKLERLDMLSRRHHVDIPEFYVGSIVAITSSDKHRPGTEHRFLGICIQRACTGLRATCILRNVIDGQGVEINYELYDPTVKRVEVLRLEKRQDSDLLYLRDALLEYSTFDPNMEMETLPEGTPVPINPIKVKLKPRPWLQRYERMELKGVQNLGLPERFYKRAKQLEKPWEKYDLMKEYMRTIPEEEQNEIFSGIHLELGQMETRRKKMKRQRTFLKPIKLA